MTRLLQITTKTVPSTAGQRSSAQSGAAYCEVDTTDNMCFWSVSSDKHKKRPNEKPNNFLFQLGRKQCAYVHFQGIILFLDRRTDCTFTPKRSEMLLSDKSVIKNEAPSSRNCSINGSKPVKASTDLPLEQIFCNRHYLLPALGARGHKTQWWLDKHLEQFFFLNGKCTKWTKLSKPVTSQPSLGHLSWNCEQNGRILLKVIFLLTPSLPICYC